MTETPDTRSDRLVGVRVLIAEDEVIVAMELQEALEDNGAEAVGPCHTIESALAAVITGAPSVAVLDVRLGRSTISPVAAALAARGVPFVFYSGQSDKDAAISEWRSAPLMSKPCAVGTLIAALESVLRRV